MHQKSIFGNSFLVLFYYNPNIYAVYSNYSFLYSSCQNIRGSGKGTESPFKRCSRQARHGVRSAGLSVNLIAPLAVSWPVTRNGVGVTKPAAHTECQSAACGKAVRPRLICGPVERHIKKRLGQLHSPEQVANTLVVGSQASPSVTISYRHVARDKDDGGKLYKSLRIRGKRPYRRRFNRGRPTIPNRVPIRLRPQIFNKRRRYGDWEADLGKEKPLRVHSDLV